MDSEEYIKALFEKINKALSDKLIKDGTFTINGHEVIVKKVQFVDTEKIKTTIELHQILSGKEQIIFVEGEFRIEEQYGEFTRSVNYRFWIQKLMFIFNQKSEEFEILAINDFYPLKV